MNSPDWLPYCSDTFKTSLTYVNPPSYHSGTLNKHLTPIRIPPPPPPHRSEAWACVLPTPSAAAAESPGGHTRPPPLSLQRPSARRQLGRSSIHMPDRCLFFFGVSFSLVVHFLGVSFFLVVPFVRCFFLWCFIFWCFIFFGVSFFWVVSFVVVFVVQLFATGLTVVALMLNKSN